MVPITSSKQRPGTGHFKPARMVIGAPVHQATNNDRELVILNQHKWRYGDRAPGLKSSIQLAKTNRSQISRILDTYLKDGTWYQNYLQKARLSLRLLCSFYNPLLKIRHESRLKHVKQTLK
jgi:hypothetical protein